MICKYCGEELVSDGVFWGETIWIDKTGGDCCSGDDDLVNENGRHMVETPFNDD